MTVDWSNPFKNGSAVMALGAAGNLAGNMLGNGYSSSAGNALQGLSSVASAIPGPWGSIASGALSVLGGGANALFGSKVNQAALNSANADISRLQNFQSNASSFDDIQGPQMFGTIGNVYSGGVFSKKSARRKNNALRQRALAAYDFATRSVENNVNNLQDEQMNSLLTNFAAYGGDIHINPSKRGTFTSAAKKRGMGVQEFASRVLSNKEDYSPAMVKKANFARNAAKWNAFGGDLMTNGATWYNGFTYIGNGGSHESNPNEGVQVGVDPQGIPNLVEEGEVIWNDYVFSKRLKVPKSFKDKYKLKNGGPISFADAAKKFAEENKERPNDPISKKGRDALLTTLMDQQENVRLKKQQREAKAQFNSLTHDEQLGIMQMAQQSTMPVGPEEEDNTMINTNVEEQTPIMAAFGGRLFSEGGPEPEKKKYKFYLRDTDEKGNPKATLLNDIPDVYENYNNTTGQTWDEALAAKGYIRVGKPQKSKDGYIEYFLQRKTPPTSKEDTKITMPLKLQQTSSRYTPVIGAGISALTDAFGLTNKPDYSAAAAVEAESNGTPRTVSFSPIGDYMTYTPLDRNYYLNQIRSSAAASRRALTNVSGGNRGTTMASILGSDYNTIGNMGALARQVEEYNLGQKQRVAEFNRGTNQFNAQGIFQADKANQEAYMDADKMRFRGIATGAQMRAAEDARVAAARSTNLTNFLQGLGDIGNENEQRNWLKTLYASGYFGNSPIMERVLYGDDAAIANYIKNNPEATVDDVVTATDIKKDKVTRYFKKNKLTI